MKNFDIEFKDKSFCFTGTMAEIERIDAQKEVKLRGGDIYNKMNDLVDYLIVGSTPNPAWKFGKYGLKIDYAIKRRKATGRPFIVHEEAFINSLSCNMPITTIAIKEKLVDVNIFFSSDKLENYTTRLLDIYLDDISRSFSFKLKKSVSEVEEYMFLFDTDFTFYNSDNYIIQYSLHKRVQINENLKDLENSIYNYFSKNNLNNIQIDFNECKEGTVLFTKRKNEILYK